MRETKKEIMARKVTIFAVIGFAMILIILLTGCSQLPIKTISNPSLRNRIEQQKVYYLA